MKVLFVNEFYGPVGVPKGLAPREQGGRSADRRVLRAFLRELRFYPAALWRVLRMPRHDVTVFMTEPPLLFVLGPLVRWIKRTRFVCWSQALFPEVEVELGMLERRSPLTALWRLLAGWALRRADLVIAVGETMEQRLVAKGVSADRIAVVHGWADGDLVKPVAPAENPFLKQHSLQGKFVVMYCGNFGPSEEFGTLLEAAKLLKDAGDVVFLFVGEGMQLDAVKTKASGLRVSFLPLHPEHELSNCLSAASVHVVTLKPGLEGMLVPKNLYSAMAVARPVIFVGGSRSEVALVLEEAACGLRVEPGDAKGFMAAVLRLKATTGERDSMGKRAYEAFRAKYDRKIGTARIGQLLADMVGQ